MNYFGTAQCITLIQVRHMRSLCRFCGLTVNGPMTCSDRLGTLGEAKSQLLKSGNSFFCARPSRSGGPGSRDGDRGQRAHCSGGRAPVAGPVVLYRPAGVGFRADPFGVRLMTRIWLGFFSGISLAPLQQTRSSGSFARAPSGMAVEVVPFK